MEQVKTEASRGRGHARVGGLAWFLAGGALALLFVGVVAIIAVVAIVAGGERGLSVHEVARLVARPLIAEGEAAGRSMTEAEMLAGLSSMVAEARALGERGGELGEVAQEYSEALGDLLGAAKEAPTPQPLVRAGIDAWRGSLEDDSGAFMLGLLGVGSALSTISEFSDAVATIHARMVACRLRVAAIAARHARPESRAEVVAVKFEESGRLLSRVKDDTISLTNVSGRRLTNAIVSVELTGRAGERFANVFFAERWEPGQTMLAVCPSDRPFRETVRNVSAVRVRVIADGRSTGTIELRLGR